MAKHDSWTELLGVIVHDLKQPITAVKGYIELFQQAGPMNDRQQRFSDRALVSLEHMSELVTMLLDIAWIDADKPVDRVECDLAVMIEAAVAILESTAAPKGVTVETDIDLDLGVVMGDVQRLPQVVNNLVGNAIKYNRDGGRVWITARGSPEEVRVSVRDTGPGIPAEEIAHVFDPYFRSHHNNAKKIEGTGLGLTIAKGVVAKHGGRIWAESVPGEGTTFTFTLPRQPDGVTVELGGPAAADRR
jgi:signal transduction histidine kinase